MKHSIINRHPLPVDCDRDNVSALLLGVVANAISELQRGDLTLADVDEQYDFWSPGGGLETWASLVLSDAQVGRFMEGMERKIAWALTRIDELEDEAAAVEITRQMAVEDFRRTHPEGRSNPHEVTEQLDLFSAEHKAAVIADDSLSFMMSYMPEPDYI